MIEVKHQKFKKLTEETIKNIIMLRANGHKQRDIVKALGVSNGSVSKYSSGVKLLPKSKWKSIEELLYSDRYDVVEKSKDVEYPADVEWYIEEYEPGTRFLGPLDQIPLVDLQKLMEEPTGYKSPLNMEDWADSYLGGYDARFLMHSPHMWCKTQREIFRLWEEHQRLMVETFRDLGKTMTADAIVTKNICENVDSNYFIMSETRQKAAFRVKHVGDILLTNKPIIADYGFLPHMTKYEGHRQSWTRDQITVKRHFKQTDPSLMAFSSDSANATGAHFAGGIFDDVWSFKLEQSSENNKEKWLGWYDGELEGCLEKAWELWLLTRKGPTDLYQEIEDRQFHAVFKRPAVLKFPSKYEILYKKVKGRKIFDKVKVNSKDWEITDDGNGRFSIEYFIEKMTKMDAVKWESEYQLNPIAAKGRFWKWSDLRFINGLPEWKKIIRTAPNSAKIIGFMDLAFGKSARADFTALVILGTWGGKYYFLELFLKRGASEKDMMKMIADAAKMFPELSTIYIEDDLQQADRVNSLKHRIGFLHIIGFATRQEMQRLRREDSAIRAKLDPKPLRIWSQIEAIIEDNIFYVNKYMRNFKEFKDEFLTFPSCKHFDVLDAVGNGISCLQKKARQYYYWSG